MNALVLDTNIISYLMKGDSRGELYKRHLEGKTLSISFMTIGELYEGAYRKEWSEKKLGKLKSELRKYLVIPFSPRVCERWGWIRSERKNQPISIDDAWIAATALAHNSPLVTHNPKDFVGISGLEIVTEQI